MSLKLRYNYRQLLVRATSTLAIGRVLRPTAADRTMVEADIWMRLFEAVSNDPDMEYAMVDATIVKVHRHGQGAKGGPKARRSAARKAA